jgi:hypothetical protein
MSGFHWPVVTALAARMIARVNVLGLAWIKTMNRHPMTAYTRFLCVRSARHCRVHCISDVRNCPLVWKCTEAIVRASIRQSEATMHPSYRALFLIGAGCAALHVPALNSLIILLGFLVFEWVDERVAFKAKRKRLARLYDVIFGWKECQDDPSNEEQGEMQRVRLTGQNQIITVRVADLLKETL